MKGNALVLVGFLFVAAGITGLIHPQWQGRDKKAEVDIGSRSVEIDTRKIIDFPPLFSGAVLVIGLCTAGLGGISRRKSRAT
jgi:hypothetical protein